MSVTLQWREDPFEEQVDAWRKDHSRPDPWSYPSHRWYQNVVLAALVSEMDRQGMIDGAAGMPISTFSEGGQLSPDEIRNGLRNADADHVLPPDHETRLPVEDALLSRGYGFVNVGREFLLSMKPDQWLEFWRDWLAFLEGGADHGGIGIDP